MTNNGDLYVKPSPGTIVSVFLVAVLLLSGVIGVIYANRVPEFETIEVVPAPQKDNSLPNTKDTKTDVNAEEPTSEDLTAIEPEPQSMPEIEDLVSTPIMLPDNFAFRQDDNRWRYDSLGFTSDMMQDYGCTVTSVAAAVSNLTGKELTPQALNDRLANAGGYTRRGWLIWDKVSEVTNNDITVDYSDDHDDEAVEACMLDDGYPVVKTRLKRSGIIHWVLVVGTAPGDYLVRDPLSGTPQDDPILLSSKGDKVRALRCIRNASN